MKRIQMLIAIACLVGLISSGCADTKAGAFRRKAFFANLEFESAKAKVWDFDSTGKTNHYEEWEVQGLKSDTQKALQTIDKTMDTMKTIAEKAP